MKTKRSVTRKGLGNESWEEVADEQLDDEVRLGDVIWIETHGDSFWPAQVVDENTVSESNKPGNKSVGDVLVRLYGSYTYLYADPIKCRSDFEMHYGYGREIFKEALEQDRHLLKSGRSKGQGSKSTGSTRARRTRGQKAEVNGGNSKGSVSEKEGKPQHSAEKNNLVRVSPRRQLSATTQQSKATNVNLRSRKVEAANSKALKQDEVKKKRGSDSQSTKEEAKSRTSKQDGVLKKLKSDSPIAEGNAKSQTSKKDEMLKKLRPRSPRAGEGKSKPSKQDGMLKNPMSDEDKARSKTSEQDGVLKKLKKKSPSDEDPGNRTPKQGQVLKQCKFNSPSSGMTLSEKSNELSARRMRVMQNLALVAPSGSPFHKNGHINLSL